MDLPYLHETPEIAAGIDRLMATVPHFADTDLGAFYWRRRNGDFAGLLHMILGQQVSVQAAAAMWAKLTAVMPEPAPAAFLKLNDAQLSASGFSRQKMRYGRALAETLVADPRFLARLDTLDDAEVVTELTRLPGIGRWSAEVYLMFCLGRPDIWPMGDLGIVLGAQYLMEWEQKPTEATLLELAEPWRPHRSAASLLVWHHYSKVAADRRREQRQASKRSAEERS